jgi:Spy/CpxP family protein refolding chaperone
MKRIALITITLIAIATMALAQQPRRMGPHGGPGGPPPNDRAIAQFLGLTSDQQTQIDALHQSLRTTIEPLFEQKRAEDEKLHSMIESSSPDATAIGKQVLAVHAIDEQIKAAHDAMDQKIESLLNAEQKVKFEAFLAARHVAGPPPPPR